MEGMKKSLLLLAVSAMIIPMLFFATADLSAAEDDETTTMVEVVIYDDVVEEVPVGETLNSIDVGQRDGFIFDGWLRGNEKIDGDTVVTAEMTDITGEWTKVGMGSLNLSNDSAIVVVVIVASLIVITLVRGRFN